MASVKFGLIVTDLKGKVGGMTFQGGNKSKVLRSNSNTKNRKSTSLSNSNNKLVQITSQWKELSDANKILWQSAASLWPFVDKYGDTYYGSGFQCYTAYNRNLLTIGSSPVASPNVVSASLNVGPFSFSSHSVASVRIVPTLVLIPSQYWLVYASPALSSGRNDNNAPTKLIAALDMRGVASFNANTYYPSVFGNFIQRSKVVFKICQVNPLYPFQYFPTVISTIIS